MALTMSSSLNSLMSLPSRVRISCLVSSVTEGLLSISNKLEWASLCASLLGCARQGSFLPLREGGVPEVSPMGALALSK